ncbi:hypothetical protein [Streptomyces mexicanus]|uniref:hypothetical protein n=1 Tax=Streptomyces mexicanus TaxID=178566 RepID=UPI00366813F9
MGDSHETVRQEFAAWLREVHIRGGKPSLRQLEEKTEAWSYRVSKSTMQEMLSGKRFPNVDQAIAFAKAASNNDAQVVDKTREKWRSTALVLNSVVPAVPSAPDPAQSTIAAPAHTPPSEPPPPDPAGPQGRHRPLPPSVVLASLATAGVAALVAWFVTADPFGSDAASPARAGSSASAGAVPAQTVAAADTPTSTAAKPGTWTGQAPIAVQASLAPFMCASAWFDGTAKQYLSQLQPGELPPQTAVRLNPSIQLTVQGRTQQSVLLTGMHINITARHPKPATGIVVKSGQCGGGVTERHFDVNLSATPPTLTAKAAVDDYTGKVTSPAVNFPYKISLTDPEVFRLDVTKDCPGDCTFTVTLDWVADGKKGTSVLDNQGRGFRSVEPASLPHYQLQPGANGMELQQAG